MDGLNEALERHVTEIEVNLAAALAEREALRAREQELTALIDRAEAALNIDEPAERLNLHEAMTIVLGDEDNEWMHAKDLAAEVNRHRLYHKRDRSAVESNQISAMVTNYSHLFEKDQGLVRLRTGERPESDPAPAPLSKYDALRDFLLAADGEAITISFDDVASLVGSPPRSAWGRRGWWSNESSGFHVHARSWRTAGFRVAKVDQREGWVRFQRDEG